MYKLLSFLLLVIISSSQAETFTDDFSKAELTERQATRGLWKFENNIATCKADPELYKKFKNHGPIIKYPRKCKAGTVEFEMKATDCSRIVFTFNGDGHIFRLCLADKEKSSKWISNRIIAWSTKSSKENKGDSIRPKEMPDAKSISGKWVKFKIAVKDKTANLSIADFTTTIEHAALARDKNMIMLSFADGDIALKNFKFTPAE
jgi:hypothetical protein